MAALLLAAFPFSLSTASAVTNAHVRFINQNDAAGAALDPPIDLYVDGALLVKDLPPGGSFGNWFETDALGNGLHTLQACISGAGGPLQGAPNTGFCPTTSGGQAVPAWPAAGVALNLVGGTNYTVVLGPQVAGNGTVVNLFTGVNDTSPTDFGFTRITIHNTLFQSLNLSFAPTSYDLCVDGDKVLTAITSGTSQQVEVEAQQQANFQLFPSPIPETAACSGASATVDLVAGTNYVVTLTANGLPECTTDCAQVLFVDQARHPNVGSASAFCAVIPKLATVQGEFKSTVGGVDPADSFTFPSAGAVKTLADDITALVSTGDVAVTNDIKPQWEVISAGLRQLVQTFKLVNYDLNGLSSAVREGIVEAANGFKLPGVPTPTLDGAIAALTAWFKGNCAAAPASTPASPAATPAAAGPRFTG